MRVDHAAGETFFANQDGDGQQENIDYFDAGSASSPGAPGAANADVIKLRNDSPSSSKEFVLSIYRESLPASWIATINNGNPVVTLGPGQEKNIPFKVKQTKPEAVGTTHSMRIYASSRVTFHHFGNPADAHNGYLTLGGVQVKVAVLRKPKLACRSIGNREVIGKLTGVKSKLREYGSTSSDSTQKAASSTVPRRLPQCPGLEELSRRFSHAIRRRSGKGSASLRAP